MSKTYPFIKPATGGGMTLGFWRCTVCKIWMGFPPNQIRQLQQDQDFFYCPTGHKLLFANYTTPSPSEEIHGHINEENK